MQEENFGSILTNIGKAKVANATLLNGNIALKTLKVGDSNGTYYNPTEDQTELKNTVYECAVGAIKIDTNNPNWITVETLLPGNIGGFTIREVGLFDADGDMIVVGKYPETYKPLIENGASKDINVRIIFEVSNTENVTVNINPSVIIATKEDINNLQEQIENNDSQLKEKANLKDVKIFSNLADIGLSANDMTTDFSNNVLKIIKAIGANRRICLYPYQTESNTNLYNSIKTWCGFNTDAYQLYIDTSFNGAENLPNKIEVIPNYNNGNNKYFIGFFDNQLGICREIQFVDDTGWIDISSALNGKVKGHARIRRIWNQVFFELDFSGELINENETILVIPKEYAPRRRDEFPFCRFTAGVMTIGIKRDATVFMDYVNTGTYNTRSYVSCQASYLID